jgi:hypothetical protein
MSQDHISALFDGLFFIIVGLLILVSSALESYSVFENFGLMAALVDFLPGLLWSAGTFLLGFALYKLSLKGKQPLVFDRYS